MVNKRLEDVITDAFNAEFIDSPEARTFEDVVRWVLRNISDSSFMERHGVSGMISDGYHTFLELYDFRKVYNALLFNQWSKREVYDVHKSLRHHDGELCFGGSYFVVAAKTPFGQVTNHYKVADWDLFHIPELEAAREPFDGHTSEDALRRLLQTIIIDNETQD